MADPPSIISRTEPAAPQESHDISNTSHRDENSQDDDSTASAITTWETLLNVIALAFERFVVCYNSTVARAASIKGGTATVDKTVTAQTAQLRGGDNKSLVKPFIACLVFPLVGMGVVSLCSIWREGELKEINPQIQDVCLRSFIEDFLVASDDNGEICESEVDWAVSVESRDFIHSFDENGRQSSVAAIFKEASAMSTGDGPDAVCIDQELVDRGSLGLQESVITSDNIHGEESDGSFRPSDAFVLKNERQVEESVDASLEFMTAMLSNWCVDETNVCLAEDEPDPFGIAQQDREVQELLVPGNSTSLHALPDPNDFYITNHSARSSLSDATIQVVDTPNNQQASNHSTGNTPPTSSIRIIKAHVNQHLQFNTKVKIHYTTESSTAYPQNMQHSVLLNVLPQVQLNLQPLSARHVLDNVCQYEMCNSYYSHNMDCHSTVHFWIHINSLLKGLAVDEHQSLGFISRTFRFLLVRQANDSLVETVDWWDVSAKVPMGTDARWRVDYDVELQDYIYVSEPRDDYLNETGPREAEDQNQYLNKSQVKPYSNESRAEPQLELQDIEELPKSQVYLEVHPKSQSQVHLEDYSTSQRSKGHEEESRSQDSAWAKLVYGCLSGLVVGLGVFVPVVGTDIIRSLFSHHGETIASSVGPAEDQYEEEVEDDSLIEKDGSPARPYLANYSCEYVGPVEDQSEENTEDRGLIERVESLARPSPANCSSTASKSASNSSENPSNMPSFSDTARDSVNLETIDHASQPKQRDNPFGFETESNDSNTENDYQASSLPPVYPKQKQTTIRKKMYARRFGTDLQNSKTPRRNNLRSSRKAEVPRDNVEDDLQAPSESEAMQDGDVQGNIRARALCQTSETETTESDDRQAEERCNDPVFYSPRFDSNDLDPLPHSNTMSSSPEENIEEPAKQDVEMAQTDSNDVSENQQENTPYSPPKITRINVLPFADPPPFPPSKVTPFNNRQTDSTRQDEQDEQDEIASTKLQEPDTSPIEDQNADEQADELETQSEATFCVEGSDTNQSLVGNAEDEVKEPATVETTAPASPVFSDASLAVDNNDNRAEVNLEIADEESELNDGKVDDEQIKKADDQGKHDAHFECLSNPQVQSPLKNMRRWDFNAKCHDAQPQSPSTVAATVDSRRDHSLPLSEDRPVPRRCGAPGQSKKFAASPHLDPSDELSFKSDTSTAIAINYGAERIGQRVAKDINGVTCFGTVTEYDGKDSPEIWRVCYDDASTHREYFQREALLEALLHYEINERNDPSKSELVDHIATAPTEPYPDQSNESPKSDDTWSKREKKTLAKKRARVERRLLRTAKKPAIHRPASALIPLTQEMDVPVWEFS